MVPASGGGSILPIQSHPVFFLLPFIPKKLLQVEFVATEVGTQI